jgi:ATP-dependent DNA helicase DinG
MALGVLDSLEKKTHIFIEAPTGVGKSFAYLVPAIFFAKKHKKKAIISTHTINLQEQLIQNDIPFLEKVLPVEFKAKLLKGKSNYICPKRLKRAVTNSTQLFETEEQLVLERLYNWAGETKDGTLSDINFPVHPGVWSNVCAERGICSTKTCGTQNTECFYMKAKLEVADSDVVILNHHLFFTLFDAYAENERDGYLYKDDFVIFDEAHTAEHVAAEHIAPGVSREMVRFHLNKLYNGKKRKGFLTIKLPAMHIWAQVQNLHDLNSYFFQNIKREVIRKKPDGNPEKLTSRIYEKNIIDNILKDDIEKLIMDLRKLRPVCIDDFQLNELNDFILRFTEINYIIDEFLNQFNNDNENKNEYVYWVELSSQKEDANIILKSSPVDMSDFFRKRIFRDNNTSIFTSATLTVNRSFSYFKTRLGGEAADELMLHSPFDFYRQVKIFIPRDIPVPDKNNSDEYFESLQNWIHHFINLSEGKALALFTNSFLMKKLGDALRPELTGSGINLLIQGEGIPRTKLLKAFKKDINSVLFGLDSFWMGVDVPGEALSNLIITKLPFQVPDHPMIQARMELIDQEGGNSFLEYTLPEAILKFRQGIGRLIRNKNDKGIIAILDNRIITKSYGKYFLNSIEECEVEIL